MSSEPTGGSSPPTLPVDKHGKTFAGFTEAYIPVLVMVEHVDDADKEIVTVTRRAAMSRKVTFSESLGISTKVEDQELWIQQVGAMVRRALDAGA